MSAPPIPITVLGGYLGAGKTTLVNRLLTGAHGRRIAVIVNDFGEVAVDEQLIESTDGGVRALANGCVCCAAVDGLAAALEEIRALDPPPEHLVIEVSGVGDPWAVAQWGRTPGHTLDGVVVVVDPAVIRDWARDRHVGDTVTDQIRAADLVVVSRTDVIDPAIFDEVQGWLRELTDAPLVAGVDADLATLTGCEPAGQAPAGGHAAHASCTFTPALTTRAGLTAWLEAAPAVVVRAKGIVTAAEGALVGQRFGRRSEVVRSRAAPPVVAVMTVVVIGDEIDSPTRTWIDDLRA